MECTYTYHTHPLSYSLLTGWVGTYVQYLTNPLPILPHLPSPVCILDPLGPPRSASHLVAVARLKLASKLAPRPCFAEEGSPLAPPPPFPQFPTPRLTLFLLPDPDSC